MNKSYTSSPVRAVVLSLVCAFACGQRPAVAAPAAPPKDPLAGYHRVWQAKLPVGGERVASPALRWTAQDTYRVLVSGTLDTRKLGARFDAEYRNISAREYRVRHRHLRFASPGWVNVHGDRREHRFVYRWDPNSGSRPQQLRVSFEGVAFTFRISPARLRQESRSTLRVSLWKKGPAPRSAPTVRWDIAGVVAIVAAVLGLLVWGLRRRRSTDTD